MLGFLLFVNVVFRWMCRDGGFPSLMHTLQLKAELYLYPSVVLPSFPNHKHTSRLHYWQEALSTHHLTRGHTLSCHPVHHTEQSSNPLWWNTHLKVELNFQWWRPSLHSAMRYNTHNELLLIREYECGSDVKMTSNNNPAWGLTGGKFFHMWKWRRPCFLLQGWKIS